MTVAEIAQLLRDLIPEMMENHDLWAAKDVDALQTLANTLIDRLVTAHEDAIDDERHEALYAGDGYYE